MVYSGLKFNTRKTYSSAQKQYLKFCQEYELDTLPATEHTLLLYLACMYDRGLKYSTIRVYLAAVRSLHIESGMADPLAGCLRLNQALKGLLRGAPPPTQKLAITGNILVKLRSQMQFSNADHVMLWSCFTLAYFGLLRAAEFCITSHFDPTVHLTIGDIKFHDVNEPTQYMSVFIKQSKTDHMGKGVHVYIGCSGTTVCALCAMTQYINSRTWLHPACPLYTFLTGAVLSKSLLVLNLRKFLIGIGMEPLAYSGHSFRSGGGTDGALAGLADWEIKLAGRWTSDAYQRYIRAPPTMLAGLARRMTSVHSGNN